jgi:hypothetical protein
MKKLLLILLCLPIIGFGQEWNFGGSDSDYGRSVQQTADGGYIITGKARSFGNGLYDVILTKTDANGVEKWTRYLGQTLDEFGASVQQTADGGYIIAGEKEVPLNSSGLANGRDVLLIKTDTFGTQQWQKQYSFADLSDDFGYSVQLTNDGGYIILGQTKDFVSWDEDVYLIKTDANGDSLWTKTFEGVGWTCGYSVQQTTDGGFVITGRINSDVCLIKTDGSGNEQWNKTFGGTGYDIGRSVQQTTDGGYIITGSTPGGNGLADVWLIKTDGNGDSLWTKTFGGLNQDFGYAVQQTNDGGYIITGWTASFGNGGNDGGYDVWLIKTDGSGIEQWSQTFGGTNDDMGYSVQQTTNGGYIIAGETRSLGNFGGSSLGVDVYLIKTDGQGNITSTFNIPISSKRKLEKTINILGKQTKPQTNIPFIEIYDDGTVEKRIVIE